MGGNFHEKLDEVPRIKFRGFKFRGFKFRGTMSGNMNFNLWTRVQSLRQQVVRGRGDHVHEDIWEASHRENNIFAGLLWLLPSVV